MPKGDSGRIVIEVDPTLKRRLYSVLAIENSTMKDWFVDVAERFVSEREQPTLPGVVNRNQRAKQP